MVNVNSILPYGEGRTLLKFITEHAVPFKLTLSNGLNGGLLFTIADEYLSNNVTQIAVGHGILFGHFWFNISVTTKDGPKIFNMVLCPLRYLVDKSLRTQIMEIKKLATMLSHCQITVINKSKTKQIIGDFKLDVFNQYANLMNENLHSVITEIFMKQNYSGSCADCKRNVYKIRYVRSSDLINSLPEHMVKDLRVSYQNYKQTESNYLKRYQ
jgi:hypothetical protein